MFTIKIAGTHGKRPKIEFTGDIIGQDILVIQRILGKEYRAYKNSMAKRNSKSNTKEE